MLKYQHKAGLIVAASIPLLILPARISEGQWKDPVNLLGSEIVIFLMSLACWYCIIYIQKKDGLPLAAKLILSVIICCILSNLFYFTFNPFFKDFPFRTAINPLPIRILMLSSRGILMSVILIPTAYYVKKDHDARAAREEHERFAMEKMQVQNRLLEQAVYERTRALQDTLAFLQKSQDELEYQFFIQSRLVASITHDIRGPFKFLVQVSKELALLTSKKEDKVVHEYANELNRSLENMFVFVKNLLEFTKLPLKQKVSKSENVNLADLVKEKYYLFQGIIATNKNELVVDVDNSIHVTSNYNLLGIILHNLIDNANKYTRSGKIEIIGSMVANSVHLMVKNTGKLTPEHIIEWMNSDQELTDSQKIITTNQIQGIGLVLVKEIGAILDIDLSMSSDISSTNVQLVFSKS